MDEKEQFTSVGNKLVEACMKDEKQVSKVIRHITTYTLPELHRLSDNEQEAILSQEHVSEAICLCVAKSDIISACAILDELSSFITEIAAAWCLRNCCQRGDEKCLRLLLRHLGDKYSIYIASVCMRLACEASNDKIALILLNQLSNLFDRFHSGAVLRDACEQGNELIVEYVLKNLGGQIDDNAIGWAIRTCIDYQNLDSLRILCENTRKRITVNHASFALKYACKYCGYDYVLVILDNLLTKLTQRSIKWAYKFAIDVEDMDTADLIQEYCQHVIPRDESSSDEEKPSNIGSSQSTESHKLVDDKSKQRIIPTVLPNKRTLLHQQNNPASMSPRTRDSYKRYVEKRNQLLQKKQTSLKQN